MGKSYLFGREKELQELAEKYEADRAENKPIYLDADDLVDLVEWYVIRRKDQMASEVLEYGLSLHPNNTTLLVEQAYFYLDDQNKEKAKEVAEMISEDTSEVKVLKANILIGEGNYDDAEQLLDSIEDKEDLATIVDVAYLYIDTGTPEKALPWLAGGTEQNGEEEAFLAVTADCYYSQGRYEEASIIYNQLIDRNPYSAACWFGLARCYFDQRMYGKAIEACDYVIIADDAFVDAYLLRGHAYSQLGNEEKAIENYLYAEQQNALSPYFMHMLIGLNKMSKLEWEGALIHLEQAISNIDINDSLILPSLYVNAALCFHKTGKKSDAHQYCKKARDLAPEEPDVYLVEGRIYMEEGDYEKGIKKWEKALKYAPEVETWEEIGMISLELGQLSYAKMAFEQVKQMEPDFEGLNEKLTCLYLLLGDKEKLLKYNQLCESPLRIDELEKLQQMLEEEEHKDVVKIMKKFFESLE